jgi:hypothetical protein
MSTDDIAVPSEAYEEDEADDYDTVADIIDQYDNEIDPGSTNPEQASQMYNSIIHDPDAYLEDQDELSQAEGGDSCTIGTSS